MLPPEGLNHLKPRDEHVFYQKVLKWVLFDFKKFLMYPDTDKGSVDFNSWFQHVSRKLVIFCKFSILFERFEISDFQKL